MQCHRKEKARVEYVLDGGQSSQNQLSPDPSVFGNPTGLFNSLCL